MRSKNRTLWYLSGYRTERERRVGAESGRNRRSDAQLPTTENKLDHIETTRTGPHTFAPAASSCSLPTPALAAPTFSPTTGASSYRSCPAAFELGILLVRQATSCPSGVRGPSDCGPSSQTRSSPDAHKAPRRTLDSNLFTSRIRFATDVFFAFLASGRR